MSFQPTELAGPRWRATRLATALLLVALPASAEVMDKELAAFDISRALALAVGLALAAAAAHRWLLLPAFVFGPVRHVAYAWTEWHDPVVGAAISREAGAMYGLVADAGMTVAVAVHLGLWFLSSAFRHRRKSPSDDLTFAGALFAAVLLHAALGFNVTWRPFLSVPVFLAGIGVLVTVIRWKKAGIARA